MHNPLISVIIPNYNHAPYLDQRILSVLNQTYENFEVIILDDCSPDNGASKSVIEKYRRNPHISHIVYNEVNSGSTFKQWDKGFDLAKGDLIWIAESDDYCENTFLEKLIEPLLKNSEGIISYCRCITVNDKGKIGYAGPKDLQTGHYDGIQFIKKYMSIGNGIVNASSVVFRKSALQGIPEDYKTFQGAGDRLFWIYLCETGMIHFLNEGLNYFRQHPVNTTKDKNKKGINQKEDKRILDYIYNKKIITLKDYQRCRKVYVRSMIFEMIEDEDLKKELYAYWGFNFFEQKMLRIEAWMRKIKI